MIFVSYRIPPTKRKRTFGKRRSKSA